MGFIFFKKKNKKILNKLKIVISFVANFANYCNFKKKKKIVHHKRNMANILEIFSIFQSHFFFSDEKGLLNYED